MPYPVSHREIEYGGGYAVYILGGVVVVLFVLGLCITIELLFQSCVNSLFESALQLLHILGG
jgi:hypothetical protein